MQLSLLVALVAAIVVSENAPHEPVDAGGLRLCLALAGGLGVILFAAVCSRAVARAIDRDQDRRLAWLRTFTQLKQAHLGAWLAVAGTTMFALDWPQLVRYNWGLDHAILVKDLLILAPIWMPLMLSWSAFYEVELAIHRSLTRRASCRTPRPRSRRGAVTSGCTRAIISGWGSCPYWCCWFSRT